jgi:hypothetical protein
MTKQPTPTLSVRSIDTCAVLLAQGIPMLDAVSAGSHLVFTFDNSEDRAKLASGAIVRNQPLPIRDYLDGVRRCKELIAQHRLIGEGK